MDFNIEYVTHYTDKNRHDVIGASIDFRIWFKVQGSKFKVQSSKPFSSFQIFKSSDLKKLYICRVKFRGVVQSASILAWGASGRPFESGHSDEKAVVRGSLFS